MDLAGARASLTARFRRPVPDRTTVASTILDAIVRLFYAVLWRRQQLYSVRYLVTEHKFFVESVDYGCHKRVLLSVVWHTIITLDWKSAEFCLFNEDFGGKYGWSCGISSFSTQDSISGSPNRG